MEKTLKIVTFAIPPSKKNNQQIFHNKATGSPFITSSYYYKVWELAFLKELRVWKKEKVKEGIKFPLKVSYCEVFFYVPNRRRLDSHNKWEGIADCLCHKTIKIIEDDSIFHLPDERLRLGGLDPINPRVEIILYFKDEK